MTHLSLIDDRSAEQLAGGYGYLPSFDVTKFYQKNNSDVTVTYNNGTTPKMGHHYSPSSGSTGLFAVNTEIGVSQINAIGSFFG
jgi:hypothetical protein